MEDCSIGQSAVVSEPNQTLEAFVAASRLYTKFDCLVVRQNFSRYWIVKLVYIKSGWLPGNAPSHELHKETVR